MDKIGDTTQRYRLEYYAFDADYACQRQGLHVFAHDASGVRPFAVIMMALTLVSLASVVHITPMITEIMNNGGFILWAIALSSLVALSVAIDRALRYRRWQKEFNHTWQRLQQQIELRTVKRQDLPEDNGLGRVLHVGLRQAKLGPDAARTAAMDMAQQEVSLLERGLGVLSIVSQVAPLLGLLGTVAGLMEAFQAARDAGAVSAELLAGGIFKALGTTAAGLGVAIPVYIVYGFLSSWSGRLVDQLEQGAAELPRLLGKAEGATES
ncbi:MAG: MotA/TolQ/ExbB proton channel family protein [Planctomycetes bacterium]|nr:MotA/TolQ/ExbB proton channel family protein [Planctomycetota bacterium]